MRLIDADEIQKYLEDNNTMNEWCVSQYSADWISSFIENRPTVDIKTEVAREIFAEIERNIQAKINSMPFDEWEDGYFIGARGTLIRILHEITELKNKYTKEGVGE